MPKHQIFVDYFTYEFMEELWALHEAPLRWTKAPKLCVGATRGSPA